jgi:hypothetical protein
VGKERKKMSVVEFVDLKWLLICIYRSPHSDVYNFLDKLEALIAKVQQKRKKLIICGDWNIPVNLLQENNHVQALQSILLAYNLINTVTSPTRVSRSSVSMIDVMVTNKQFNENFTEVWNVGYSDHLAQVLYVSVNKHNLESTEIIQRKFSKRNVEKFRHVK